ncbi:MAG: cytochrome c oxidase subunit 3 [Verrucomicrobia bacterium]|nr:cytochrome c oxidase subunit 3 [Verrucomicrobiota bacterium]
MEIPYTVKPRPDTGLYNAKVGIWLFLASEVMLFGAFFSTYILLRVQAPHGFWPEVALGWPHGLLNIPIGTFNTAVLITSSVTVVMAWIALKQNNFARFQKFMAVTVACALGFLLIKTFEYKEKFGHYVIQLADGSRITGHLDVNGKSPLFWTKKNLEESKIETLKVQQDIPNKFRFPVGHAIPEDIHKAHAEGRHHNDREIPVSDIVSLKAFIPSTHPFFAIYFTMTFLHGLHVLGGALVLFYFGFIGTRMWKTSPEQFTNRIEVGGLFWHFVDLVWIFLFPVVYLL